MVKIGHKIMYGSSSIAIVAVTNVADDSGYDDKSGETIQFSEN